MKLYGEKACLEKKDKGWNEKKQKDSRIAFNEETIENYLGELLYDKGIFTVFHDKDRVSEP